MTAVAIDQRSTAQTLRPYQRDAIDSVKDAWQRDETPLVWAATGAGKTTILSQLLVETVDPYYQRALVFAHTKEIIEQIRERVANQYNGALDHYFGPQFNPGIGIVMGENDSPDARIVIATRQSLHRRRLERVLQTGSFDVVLIDEGHHVSPDSTYWQIVQRVREAKTSVKVVGFTATPKRTDKKGLGVVFSNIAYTWTILDGIKGGYLSPATRIKIKTGVDVSRVRTLEGDYDQKQLVSVLDASNWVNLALDTYREYAGERQTLAFFPKVEMSREFVSRLQAAGIPAEHIDAHTPKAERTDILRRYQKGEVRVVSNMGVLTEGFDAPQTSAILMARPTRSETLFTQVIGRGLRLFPGKSDCLILDLTVVDTKVLEVGTILGQMAECQACGAEFFKGFKHCPKCGEETGEAVPLTKPCPKCGEEIPRAARECPLCGYVIPRIVIPPDFKGLGEGLEAVVAQLFHSLSSAWFPGEDGYFSVPVGFDSAALIIVPPSFAANADRIKERLMRGTSMLKAFAESSHVDPELKTALLDQMSMLDRELLRIDHYTLYYVPPVQKDPMTGRNLSESHQLPVQYLRANTDLASLMQEADSEAKAQGGYAADKNVRWRTELASEGQIKYLRALGFRKLSKNDPSLTKGMAASLITHYLSVRRVKSHLANDLLPEPQAEVEAVKPETERPLSSNGNGKHHTTNGA